MKQTLEEAAKENILFNHRTVDRTLSGKDLAKFGEMNFVQGAEWNAKQSPWISVNERFPDKGQRVLVGFLYYYKYDNREAESRKHIDIFTYEIGVWTTDSDISYLGRNVQKDDIKVVCWMPIPSFDEILEADRDVLERIKEKEINMDRIKCITFDKAAQDALPKHIKAKMKADREKARLEAYQKKCPCWNSENNSCYDYNCPCDRDCEYMRKFK